jgi:predicted RNase H-like nuclease (RuvC/YqgF family)
MKRIPCEADLKSDNHEIWAAAVMECKTRNPYCGPDGYCHADGDCFEVKVSKAEALEQAVNALSGEVKRLSSQLKAMENSEAILKATLEHHIQSLNATYNQATNESRKWAIHFARQKFLALQKELQGEGNAS